MPIVSSLLPQISEGVVFSWIPFYLLVIVWVFQSFVSREIRIYSIWFFSLTYYSLVVIISLTWTDAFDYDFYNIQRLFARVLAPWIIALIALNIFRVKANVHMYIRHACYAAIILSCFSIYQMLTYGLSAGDDFRATATFHNPNGLAIFLVLIIPCVLYGLDSGILKKKTGWPGLLALLGGIVGTISRKGMITMVTTYIINFALNKHYKKFVVLIVVVTIMVVILSGYVFISKRFTTDRLHRQFVGKANMMWAGVRMFADSPVIGLGYQGYYQNYGKYLPQSRKDRYDAHNIFVTALANYGLLGFLPFMCIFIYPLMYSMKILLRRRSNTVIYSRRLSILCISCTIPFMMNGFYAGALMDKWITISLLYSNISFVFAAEFTEEEPSGFSSD
jgi:hypothetical protein